MASIGLGRETSRKGKISLFKMRRPNWSKKFPGQLDVERVMLHPARRQTWPDWIRPLSWASYLDLASGPRASLEFELTWVVLFSVLLLKGTAAREGLVEDTPGSAVDGGG